MNYQSIAVAVENLKPSPLNPRKNFDADKLRELAASIQGVGIIEPIIARAVNGHYEIVAGERRWKAAKLADLAEVPVVVRELTDTQVLELMVIENNQRDDISALEEADGFSRLLKTGYDLEKLAARIGRSKKYIYDRVKLLDLVPSAKALLAEGRLTAGHGILLARLKPEDQARAIDPEDGGAFEMERGRGDEEADDEDSDRPDDYAGLKARSVRELNDWITSRVRFDPAHFAAAAPLDYGPVVERVIEANAKPGRGKKVISITLEHFVQPDARADDGERTFGPASWKYADGQEHVDDYPRRKYVAKPCAHAVLGVVVAGRQYGQAFDVCIARDRCEVHWKKEIAERETNQKLRESGQAVKADRRETAEAQRRQREDDERRRKVERWKTFQPALQKAAKAAAAKQKIVAGRLYALVLKFHQLPAATKPADLPKALLDQAIGLVFDRYSWVGDEPKMVEWATLLGVDVKALEPRKELKAQPVQTSAPKAARKKAGKKKAGKKR